MPRYRYRALRPTGSEIAGELVAADRQDAAAQLQSVGSFPIEVTAPTRRPLSGISMPLGAARRVGGRDLVLFTRQLATLVAAGVTVDRALAVISGGGRSPARRLAADLLAAVNRGESLSQACAEQPGLPRHYGLFLAAGEARGDVAGALERLAQVLERSRATTRALCDALIYPASVAVVACLSIGFLLGFVVPQFQALLAGLQHQPPLLMRLLLALSAIFQQAAMPVSVVGTALIALVVFRGRDAGFRLACHRRLLALPGLGSLIAKIEAERLLYLLGSLIAAGVHLPSAVTATRAAMTSEVFRAGLVATEQGVERGDGIAAALLASRVVPDVAAELVRIGEESGAVAPMLLNAGDVLRREFEALSLELIGLVTPISIAVLGVLIGTVAAALLGTVMQVYDLAL